MELCRLCLLCFRGMAFAISIGVEVFPEGGVAQFGVCPNMALAMDAARQD